MYKQMIPVHLFVVYLIPHHNCQIWYHTDQFESEGERKQYQKMTFLFLFK